MRSQYCREHIDKVAEECGLEKSTVSDVKQAADFCVKHSEYSDCSTAAIITLIRIKDPEVKEKVISSSSKALKSGRSPIDGKVLKDNQLTGNEIRVLIARIDKEVRSEYIKEHPEKKPETIAQSPTTPSPSPETAAKIAHAPVEQVKPVSPFVPGDEIQKNPGLVDDNVPDTRTAAPTLVLRSPPNVSGIPPLNPEIVTITPTRGQWRAIDNAIKRGDIKPDEKAGKDVWQVGAMRAFEAGCEVLENGGRV